MKQISLVVQRERMAPVVSLTERRRRTKIAPLVGELRRQHVHLDILCDALVAAYRDGAWNTLVEDWRYFEPALRGHMDREERDFFPELRLVSTGLVECLLAQHADLRMTLDAIAVGVEVRCVPGTDLEALVTSLRDHTEREERFFYPWLDAPKR